MANHHRQIIESREFYSINSILVLWQKLLKDDNDDLFGSGKGFATEGGALAVLLVSSDRVPG